MDLIKNINPKELVEGITGYYAHGKSMSFGYVELKKGASIPMHNHVHEQITFIIEGELDMMIGGEKCLLRNGMYHVIHSNVPHSAIALTDCKVIDAFSPVREDYRT
jgi:quercetin dioxygenase-like cupin family protein